MAEKIKHERSPDLLGRHHSSLVVIDVQQRLVPAVSDHSRLIWNCRRLIDGAGILGVPVAATEQYPEKLGGTVEPLAERLSSVEAKRMFSCRSLSSLIDAWHQQDIHQLVLCGIETHVCVLQTAFDLVAVGFQVAVVADAVGSRFGDDHCTGIERMRDHGIQIVSTESVLFEWCETSLADEFKQISQLVRETPPEGETV